MKAKINEITPEMIEQAKTCKTAAELVSKAKEAGIELAEAEAEEFLAELESGEIAVFSKKLSDSELDAVAGGAGGPIRKSPYNIPENTCIDAYKEGKYYWSWSCGGFIRRAHGGPECVNFDNVKDSLQRYKFDCPKYTGPKYGSPDW